MHKKIEENINNVLRHAYIPELGEMYSGKVRDIYRLEDKLLMITSDRVSCFDRILNQCIPYKGKVLNEMSRYFFRMISVNAPMEVKHATLNALPIENLIHPNAILAEYVTPIKLEMVVRGYRSGSFDRAYAKGKRRFFENKLRNGIKKYEKLDSPIITPSTKAEAGHDVELKNRKQAISIIAKDFKFSFEEAENIYQKMENISHFLFERGTMLAKQGGLILVDTKYEFGLKGKELFLIDEINTPDSSRYWMVEDYKKGKPAEWSKEFVRQYLLNLGFSGEGEIPDLTEEVIIETSKRYINIYERIVGNFEFYDEPIEKNLVRSLKNKGYIEGMLAVIIMGSENDMPHVGYLEAELKKQGITSKRYTASVHRKPSLVEKIVNELNKSIEPLVIISVAGGTDALSGTLGSLSKNPVISCPPYDKSPKENLWMINQYIGNPRGSSCALVPRRENAVKAVLQYFNLQHQHQNS